MALQCVTCGLPFRNRNGLGWRTRQEHLQQAAASADQGRAGPWRRLGGFRGIQYRRTTMRTHRQRQATTIVVALPMLLGSLWAGTFASAGTSADQLTTSRTRLGIEAVVPPDRAPALRPAAERPDPGGRVLPLLLGLVLAGLAAGSGLARRRPRSDLAPIGSRAWSSHREARAPPFLQPA
jgi:hypothetical protein